MLETLLGNETVKDSLAAALSAGRLSHSVLLCGEAGTGAGYAARCLAADYLYPQGGRGAHQVMECGSAEVLLVEGEGASGEIKIERIRAVRRALFSTALSASGRVVLVRGAEKLNGPSANALLKVLEEPPAGVLFVLTAPSEATVLPTIRSRCSIYTLAPVPRDVCAATLRRHCPQANADELSALFGGKIGTALRCARDAAEGRRLADAKQLADAVQNKDAYAALVLLQPYEKDRAETRSLLQYAAQVCSAALRGEYAFLDAARAADSLPVLAKAQAQLAANGNHKLVLTCLAAQLTA